MGQQIDLFEQLASYFIPEESKMSKAIRLSEDKQNKIVNNWSDNAIKLLTVYCITVKDFIAEDFRKYAEANGLEQPREPRAYGGLFVRAKKIGLIESTGQYRKMKSEQSHSCPKMVWKIKNQSK